MKAIRAHLTYANVISTLALFLVLGGTAFALARNSVGTAQLKPNAVVGSKVKNGSLTAAELKTNTLPFPNPPPSGTTLRGAFALRDVATAAGEEMQQGIGFGFTLRSAPAVHYVFIGAPAPAGCSGGSPENPKADPGNLCIYESAAPLNAFNRGEFDPASSASPAPIGSAKPYGFGLYAQSSAAGVYRIRGSWAVTAP